MFCFKADDTSIDLSPDLSHDLSDSTDEYAMSAMNCPKHCVIYKHVNRSYKNLPLRFADCGNLHRNELSGTLTGLTRVRQFCQDDAHIFCTREQIGSEIRETIEFMKYVYDIFGFKFEVALSTRPDEFMGSIDLWQEAETILKNVLDNSGLIWSINLGDGAFYGPKIDIKLTDSLKSYQCATIQLDFQLPLNFKLEYVDSKGELQTPVMIHRAIFGSFERFIAILAEHYNGKWPLWLSPKQVCIIPISNEQLDYANEIKSKLVNQKLHVVIDSTDNTLSHRIRKSIYYNYVVIIGQKEMNGKSLNVRYRDSKNQVVMTIDKLIAEIGNDITNHI